MDLPLTSNHCMYVMFWSMTEQEILNYLDVVIPLVDKEICLDDKHYVPNCKYFINVPKNREGKLMNHAFVWVTSPHVYSFLLKASIDPTDANTEVVKPKEEVTLTVSNLTSIDWADDSIPTKSTFVLPEIDGKKPKFCNVSLDRIDDEEYDEGKLFCTTRLPKDYTNHDLADLFTPFVTRGRIICKKTQKGNAFVTFDNKDDAYFALTMRKKYYDPRHRITLYFEHAKAR